MIGRQILESVPAGFAVGSVIEELVMEYERREESMLTRMLAPANGKMLLSLNKTKIVGGGDVVGEMSR